MTKEEVLAAINRLSKTDREWVARLPESERVAAVTLLTMFGAEFVEEPEAEEEHDPYDIPY